MTTTFFNTKFFYSLLIWLVLLLGFIGSGAVSYWVKLDIDALQHQQFLYYCEEIKLKIVARLKAHEQTLIASSGLFDASDSVTRSEWHGYTTRLLINNHFNGIQGIGFIPWIPLEQLAAHIAHVRADGFPNYTVRPEGNREGYAPVTFIEPFNERNVRAFGYDLYPSPFNNTIPPVK